MKISSYNINGVRAAERKGFVDWVSHSNPDIICIQELRADESQIPEEITSLNYHKYLVTAEKKGYSGVAIFTKTPAREVKKGLGVDWIDSEGRVITAEFENFRVVSAYFPSGTTGDVRQDMKMKFLTDFIDWGKQLAGDEKPTVVCGDFNICHNEIDIHNPEKQHKTSGFLPEERAWVTSFLETGYEDVYRNLHPGEKHLYSWWSYRAGSKGKNKGWRIDYQMATPNIANKAIEAVIEHEWDISDHAPVSIIYSL
jgi:exodeoxyribonuclease-3